MSLDEDTVTTPTPQRERRALPTVARRSPYSADRRLIDQLDKGWKPRLFRRKPSSVEQEEQ
jgi:hypothetical protein